MGNCLVVKIGFNVTKWQLIKAALDQSKETPCMERMF